MIVHLCPVSRNPTGAHPGGAPGAAGSVTRSPCSEVLIPANSRKPNIQRFAKLCAQEERLTKLPEPMPEPFSNLPEQGGIPGGPSAV